MSFWAKKLILSSFELIFGSSVGRPKLILSPFSVHRLDGRSSFCAHFWLSSLMTEAHFEFVGSMPETDFGLILSFGSMSKAHFELILGSL